MLPKEDIQYINSNLSGLVEKLKNKSIFITGGTGFIGKWRVEGLVHLNEENRLNLELYILSRDEKAAKKHFDSVFPNHSINFIEGDIRSFSFPNTKVDFIIHAATDASAKMNNEQPIDMMDIIYNGTNRALMLAKRDQAKFLHISSGAIYGKQPDAIESFSETFIGGPDISTHLSAYGETKRSTEVLCYAYNKQCGIDFNIARCFAVVGPYLPVDTHIAIGNCINNALKGEDIIVKSDGKPLRTYMYAADLTIWLIHILLNGESCQAYNVGGEEIISIKELAHLVQSVQGTGSVKILNQNPPIYINLNYICDMRKAKQAFGFESQTSLLESISKTIQYHKEKK
ncbi:MAG: NAD-dependent epimerase/dehydratase family protein [Bacteroidetes bacterium]|nr:NAD-dependent epimerase/dehydratase family protein [Bacteroidota bacterium]